MQISVIRHPDSKEWFSPLLWPLLSEGSIYDSPESDLGWQNEAAPWLWRPDNLLQFPGQVRHGVSVGYLSLEFLLPLQSVRTGTVANRTPQQRGLLPATPRHRQQTQHDRHKEGTKQLISKLNCLNDRRRVAVLIALHKAKITRGSHLTKLCYLVNTQQDWTFPCHTSILKKKKKNPARRLRFDGTS